MGTDGDEKMKGVEARGAADEKGAYGVSFGT